MLAKRSIDMNITLKFSEFLSV